MAKQVIDIHVSKGMTEAQSNEHKRNWTDKGWQNALSKGNYDPSRERLNFELVKGGVVKPVDKSLSIPERIAKILQERGIKDPNAGLSEPKFRTVVNFIFGGSRDRMHEIAFGSQKVNLDKGADNSHINRTEEIENWAKDVYDFVCKKYGEENIAAFVVHLDEMNPHVHCTLLPIQDGKFAYKRIFAGKDKYEFSERMKQLHSDFASVNEKWGMSRGTSVSETGARHRTTEEYRRHLSQECTNLEDEIEQYKKTLSDLSVEIRLAERRVKGLNSMIENLEKEKTDKQSMIKLLNQELISHNGDAIELKEKIARLEKEMSVIQEKLDDKHAKLDVAEQQLSVLRNDMQAISERKEELQMEARKISSEVQTKVGNLLRDVMLEGLISEHQQRVSSMSPAEKDALDDSFITSVVERGSEVLHCATLLFLGLVDDATTFAETHGGGGGTSDLKWGRNEDEDNRAWARRCMMMSKQMMKPSSGKYQKR